MKIRRILTGLVAMSGICGALCSPAQDNTPVQHSLPRSGQETNLPQDGGLVLTNQSGHVFSVAELNTRLQSLRTAVEQTLPMLSDFNQQAGATNRLAGAISGMLSGVLGKDGDRAGASPPSSGQRLTNVLSALGALVSTNAQGSVAFDPATLRHLMALQRDLQPVAATLRELNISTNQALPASGMPPGGLTPTGR